MPEKRVLPSHAKDGGVGIKRKVLFSVKTLYFAVRFRSVSVFKKKWRKSGGSSGLAGSKYSLELDNNALDRLALAGRSELTSSFGHRQKDRVPKPADHRRSNNLPH